MSGILTAVPVLKLIGLEFQYGKLLRCFWPINNPIPASQRLSKQSLELYCDAERAGVVAKPDLLVQRNTSCAFMQPFFAREGGPSTTTLRLCK
jgi:hypothetical protein